MNIPENKTPITREFPNSGRPYMRFQIGFMRDRPQRLPIFENRRSHRIVGFEDGPPVSVFYLCGHGSTQAKAEKMAGVKVTA